MDRAELARSWATALNQVIYVSRSRDDIEDALGGFVDRVAACVADGDPDAAVAVGHDLVAAGFTKPVCVRTTLSVLGPGVSEVEGVTAEAVAPAMAAIAAGFAEASRDRLFAEQDEIRHALTKAIANVEGDLEASEARFRDMFATSAIGMLVTDLGGGVVRANESIEDMLGYRKGTLFRKRLDDVFHPEEADYLRGRYAELVDGGDTIRERTRFAREDGDTAWVRVSVTLSRDRDGRADHHVTMVEDITDLHLIEHKLSYQDTHDRLTGLANRQAFLGRVEEALGSGADIAVLHIGLDHFGKVNSGHGRAAGDTLLRVAARRIDAVAGACEHTLARLGADEFALLLIGVDDVARIAGEINEVLAEPHYVGDHGLAVTATVAVLRSPRADTDPADLLHATDITLRALKAQGRRQWGMVDQDEVARRRAHDQLVASIPGAWESGELTLDYRPVAAIDSGERIGVQALLRWNELGHRRVCELLRDTGLSVPVAQWAIVEAARDLADQPDTRLYVELTAEQAADQDLVGTVRRAREEGLASDRLDLGFPVRAVDDPQAEDNLTVLAELGVRIVLTAFGRAHGDVVAVEDHPVAAVRMARSVVERVEAAGEDSLFVRAVRELVPLVRAAGVSVIVPDVVCPEYVAWWRAVGADVGVGGAFGS